MNVRALLEQQLGTAYRIERELGGGGMSHVFLAEEVALGRRVVVKVLPPEAAATVDAERFRREIQLAASLQHPHVVQLLSAGASGELLWYSMPYVEGESLRGRLTREHELPVDIAVRVWREVLDALSYAHGRGVVHRDIKPENVLVSGRHAVVTDFGVAKAIAAATGGASMTQTGVALGTPAYMSPEQATADPSTDHRADIYAAGLVMYEMLAGHGPFPGLAPSQMMAAHVARTPDHIGTVRPNVPVPLAALVMRCLEKRPADRPQSADEVMTQLETIITPHATTPGGSVPTGAMMPVVATGGGRSWKHVAGIAAVVVIAVTGGALYATRGPSQPARVGADPTDTTVRAIGIVDFESAPADSLVAREATRAVRAKVAESTRLFTLTRTNLISFYRWAFDLADGELPPADSAVAAMSRLRTHAVVRGSVVRLGAGYTFTVDFVLPNPASPAVQSVTASADDSTQLAETSDRLAVEVVSVLERVAPRLVRPTSGGLATTSSLEALKLYQEATAVALGTRGDWGASAELLRQAVQVDSTFAPAWRRLANNLNNARVRFAEARRAASRAYAERDHVKSWERALIEGTYNTLLDRYTDAIAALRETARRGQTDAVHNTGHLYREAGEFAISERFLIRSTEGKTEFENGHATLTSLLLVRGDLQGVDSLIAWGERVSPTSGFLANARLQRLVALRANTNIREALNADARADSSPPASSVRASTARTLRAVNATTGRIGDAVTASEAIVSVMQAFESPADILRERLAGLELEAAVGRDQSALHERLRTLLAESPYAGMDPMDRPYREELNVRLALGQVNDAKRTIEAWDRDRTGEFVSVDSIVRNIARGELALADGRYPEALVRLRGGMKTACAACMLPRLARVFEVMNRPDSAIANFEMYLASTSPFKLDTDARELARTYQRLGELYEGKGDTARAIQRYENFVELWKDADPELQPRVTAIRERIAKLKKKAG